MSKSNLTIRMAGVLFLASAVLELCSITSGIPLFGAMRSGTVAMAYHLFYVGLFLILGIGLWVAKPWSLQAMFIGTIVYSLDKVMFLLDRRAGNAAVNELAAQYGGLLEIVDEVSIQQMMYLMTLLMILSWWAFLLYLYFRRSIFQSKVK